MPEVSEVSKVGNWCDQIRSELKLVKTFWGFPNPLAKKLEKVKRRIAELELLVPQHKLEGELTKFRTVSSKVETAVRLPDRKKRKKAIAEVEKEFSLYETELGQELANAKKLSKKREEYLRLLHAAEIEIADFSAYPDLTSPLTVCVNAAKQLGNRTKYDQAIGSLNDFAKKLKKQQEIKNAREKEDLEELRKRPDAEQRLAEKKKIRDEIRNLPGIRDTIDAYQVFISKVEQFLTLGRISDACKVLDQIDKLPSESDLRSASEQAIIDVAIDIEAYRSVLTQVKTGLHYLRSVADSFVVKDYEKQVEILNRQIVDQDNAEQAFEVLQKLAAEIRLKADQNGKDKVQAEKRAQEIERLLREMTPEFDTVSISTLILENEKLKILLANYEFNSALKLAESLHQRVTSERTKMLDAKRDYESISSDVDKLAKAIKDAQEQWPGGASVLGPISWRLTVLTKQATADPAFSKELYEQARKDFENIRTDQFEPYLALKAKRTQWEATIEHTVEEARAGTTQLSLALKTHRQGSGQEPPEGTTTPPLEYVGQINGLLSEWTTGTGKISQESALEDLFEKVLSELNTIIETVKDPNLGELAAAQIDVENKDAYRAAIKRLDAAIKNLDNVTSNDTKFYLSQRASCETEAKSGDLSVATSRALELAKAAEDRCDEFFRKDGLLDLRRKAVEESKRAAEAAIKSLRKTLGKKFLRESPYKPFLEKLTQELGDLEPLLLSNSEAAIGRADSAYQQLTDRIKDFATEMKSQSESGAPPTVGFAAVNAELQWIEEFLKGKDLNSIAKTQLKLFTEQFKGLKEKAYESQPMNSLPDLRKARLEMAQFSITLAGRKRLREASETLVKLLTGELKSLNKAMEYTKDLASRLEASKTTALTEGKEERGHLRLKNLQTEIATAKASPTVFQSKELALRQAEQENIKRAALLKERLELAKTYIERAKQAVKSAKGDNSLIKELERLFGIAKDNLKKNRFDDAERDVDLIRIRSDVVVKNPYGAALGSRKELVSQLKIYEDSISEFKDLVRNLAKTIKKLDEADEIKPTALAAVQKSTDALAVRFSAADAASAINRLLTRKVSKEEQRQDREKILAILRRETKKIVDSPVMPKLRDSKIEPVAIPQSIKKMENSVARLVGNTLRSVQ